MTRTKRTWMTLALAALASTACTTDPNEAPHHQASEAHPQSQESAFSLTRTVELEAARAARFTANPGELIAGRRGTGSDGLYVIDESGLATQLVAGTNVAGVAIDPATGIAYWSEDYAGNVYRTDPALGGRQIWVSGFHSGDDDPVGIAFAPADYSGDVLAAGDAVVVDRGSGGPDEAWRFSAAAAQGEVRIHTDNGTLVDAVDVAISDRDVFIADAAATVPSRIYRLRAGGALSALETRTTIGRPVGIAIDPITGSLFVLDASTQALLRVNLEDGRVTEVITGLATAASDWAGIDVSADGAQLAISEAGSDRVLVFSRGIDRVNIETESAHLHEISFGIDVDFPLRAALGVAPYSWDLVGGELPRGLELTGDGRLIGRPTEAGRFELVVRVTDTAGDDHSKALTFELDGPTPIEGGWSLDRVIALPGAVSASYNPIDGHIYALRSQAGPGDGVYRIEDDGTPTRLHAQESLAALAVDPRNGAVFFTRSVWDGFVDRIPLAGTRARWVDGFDNGDEDIVGVAIAPDGHSGGYLAPGEGLAVDFGMSNTRGVWKFSGDAPQGESALHIGAPLVAPVDVAIGSGAVYIAERIPGRVIHRLESDGTFTTMQPAVADPRGIVVDPTTGDVLVLDSAEPPRVVRFDPDTGRTTTVIDGLKRVASASVDISPDGSLLVLTDFGRGLIYTYQRPVDLHVSTGYLPPALIGTAYSEALQARFATGATSWTLIGGVLPPGLAVDATGAIAGSPTTPGTYAFALLATDETGASAAAELELRVLATDEPMLRLSKGGVRPYGPYLKGMDYTIIVENIGATEVSNHTVVEQLMPWVHYESASAGAELIYGRVPIDGVEFGLQYVRAIVWNLQTMAPGDVVTLHYRVVPNEHLPVGLPIRGTALAATKECMDSHIRATEFAAENCSVVATIESLEDLVALPAENLADLAANLAELEAGRLIEFNAEDACVAVATGVSNALTAQCTKIFEADLIDYFDLGC